MLVKTQSAHVVKSRSAPTFCSCLAQTTDWATPPPLTCPPVAMGVNRRHNAPLHPRQAHTDLRTFPCRSLGNHAPVHQKKKALRRTPFKSTTYFGSPTWARTKDLRIDSTGHSNPWRRQAQETQGVWRREPNRDPRTEPWPNRNRGPFGRRTGFSIGIKAVPKFAPNGNRNRPPWGREGAATGGLSPVAQSGHR